MGKSSSELMCCRGCLATDCNLFDIHKNQLAEAYECITGYPVLPHDGFPQRLCAVCGVLLAKSAAFRDRCRRARDCLRKQHHNKITMDYIETIDRLSHHLVFTLALSQVEVNDTRTYPLEVRDEPSIVVKDTISKHEVDPLGLDTEEHSNSPIDNDQELVDDIHSHSPIDSDQELLNDIDSHSPVDSDQELVNDIHSHLPIDDDQKLVDDIHSHSPIDNDLELLYDINSHSPLDNDQGLFDDILSHSPIDNDQELLNDKSDEVEEISKQIKIVRIPTDKVEVQKKPTRKRIMQLINKKKELKKRRIRGPSPTNECRPNFNVAELEKELNVDIEILNKEQQLADWRQFSASKKRPAAFSCQECGKGFDQLTSYQNHLLRHGPFVDCLSERGPVPVRRVQRAFQGALQTERPRAPARAAVHLPGVQVRLQGQDPGQTALQRSRGTQVPVQTLREELRQAFVVSVARAAGACGTERDVRRVRRDLCQSTGAENSLHHDAPVLRELRHHHISRRTATVGHRPLVRVIQVLRKQNFTVLDMTKSMLHES
ncbi:uncharacterized protein isoform X2 [Choristoneura fumiferana]|uniref:uncharacterized protein isoform X2 n=1 Tax=Choristoneura fumiferana TaxID=7141 RepID=UPI003D159993